MKNSWFIVDLNWVDWITLAGITVALAAIGAILKGLFTLAIAMLFLSMLIDALDGMLARKFKLERDFGRYLDSFSDVLQYLVAPALLLYQWGFNNLIYTALLILFVIAGIIRLSIFNAIGNIKDDNNLHYLGMPVFWATFIISGAYLLSFELSRSLVFLLLSVALILYSIAMIYNGRFHKFKSLSIILFLTLSGFLVFVSLHIMGVH